MLKVFKKSLIILIVLIFVLFYVRSAYNFFEEKTIIIGIANWSNTEHYINEIIGFKESMKAAGFIEQVNVKYIETNANADLATYKENIKYLKDSKVDLLHTLTTDGTIAAQEIVHDLPIVFSMVAYPVESKIIQSQNNSGNNLVGVRDFIPVYKHYYNFVNLFGDLKSFGLVRMLNDNDAQLQLDEFRLFLTRKKTSILDIGVTNNEQILDKLMENKNDLEAIFISCSGIHNSIDIKVIAKFAKQHNVPIFSCNKYEVESGAILASSLDPYQLGKIAGIKAALILQGSEPNWLVTESVRDEMILFNENLFTEMKLFINKDKLYTIDEIIYPEVNNED